MSLSYGFMLASDGSVAIDHEKANIVQAIYRQYLSGMSLKGIADFLFTQGIPSPMGKAQWTQAVINDLLANQHYIDFIISFDVLEKAGGGFYPLSIDFLGERIYTKVQYSEGWHTAVSVTG